MLSLQNNSVILESLHNGMHTLYTKIGALKSRVIISKKKEIFTATIQSSSSQIQSAKVHGLVFHAFLKNALLQKPGCNIYKCDLLRP